jgi:hypothetical protein
MAIFLTTIVLNDDGGHKERMNLIEEQERLVELKGKVQHQKTINFIDSMDVEINKKFSKLNNKYEI